MRHVTHMNESWHTYLSDSVANAEAQKGRSRVTHVNELYHTYE